MAIDRKQAIRDYKERKFSRGIYAVRCTVTGQSWVDSTPNLEAIRNRVWFQMKAGAAKKSMQSAWNEHGESSMQFEVLETIPDDVSDLNLHDALKEKKAHWAKQLNAETIF